MAMNFPIRYFPAFNVVLYALTGRDSYSWKMARFGAAEDLRLYLYFFFTFESKENEDR